MGRMMEAKWKNTTMEEINEQLPVPLVIDKSPRIVHFEQPISSPAPAQYLESLVPMFQRSAGGDGLSQVAIINLVGVALLLGVVLAYFALSRRPSRPVGQKERIHL